MISASKLPKASLSVAVVMLLFSCGKHGKPFSFKNELVAFEAILSNSVPQSYKQFYEQFNEQITVSPEDYRFFTTTKLRRPLEREIQNVWDCYTDVVVIVRTSPDNDIYQGDVLYANSVSSEWYRFVCWSGRRDVKQTNMLYNNNQFRYIFSELGKLTNSADIRRRLEAVCDETWWFITRRSDGVITRYVTYGPTVLIRKYAAMEDPAYATNRLRFSRIETILDVKQ